MGEKEERTVKTSKETEEERSEKRRREGDQTVRVKRRGTFWFLWRLLNFFQSRERFGELWWSVLVGVPWGSLRTGQIVSLNRLRVRVVTDVLVSHSSVVTEPQSFSFS